MSITPEIKAAVDAWLSAVPTLKQWKEYEAATRAEAVALCFPTPVKGTQRFDLGGGFKLKLVYGWTYTLGDKELIDPILQEKVPVDVQVNATVEAIEQLGPEAKIIVDRLIKWKPELSETEYKKLRADIPIEVEVKKLIDSILITKPASPQLAFEEPKVAS